MKRRDYEMFIRVEEETAGSYSDFARGMDAGVIMMLELFISCDTDLEEHDKEYLLKEVEKAGANIRAKEKEVKREYEDKGI